MGLFEEPDLFLRGIKDFYLVSPEFDAEIRTESSIRSTQSRMSSAASGSMTKSSIRPDYVLETRYLLAFSPPTELVLEKCTIDKEAADALIHVIQSCTTLKTIELRYCAKESTNFVSILLAISVSTSIRKFTFEYDGRNLDCRELDSVIRLIRLSRTLRTLHLNDIFCSMSQICRALDALRSNTSISRFNSLISLKDTLWPEPSKTETATLTALLLQLMSDNITLTVLYISLEIYGSYLNMNIDVLLEAFNKNINLSSMSLVDRDESVGDSKSIPGVHYLKDLAAVVLKIGRVFSGKSLVCGKSLPIELVDEIMRQVAVGSIWDDGIWKPIRRVAVDRRTIGRLMTNDEPFDAYELLYRCRSLA